MKIVRPFTVTESTLDATNVPLDDAPLWVSNTTYAVGDLVMWDLVVYESLAAGNAGSNPPGTPTANAPRWVAIGPVNRWRMFNKRVGNRWLPGLYTENPVEIDVTVTPSGVVNSIGLVGISASEVQIIMIAPGNVEVYNRTFNLTMREPVTNWYEHWFNEFTQSTSIVTFDLPAYGNAKVRAIAREPLGVAKIGTFIVGNMRKIGDTLIDSGLDFRSYSRVTEDEFGAVEVVSRGSRRSNTFRVSVDRENTDSAVMLLDRIRDEPALYVGDESMDSTIIVGWLRNSPATFSNIAKTTMNIEVWRL